MSFEDFNKDEVESLKDVTPVEITEAEDNLLLECNFKDGIRALKDKGVVIHTVTTSLGEKVPAVYLTLASSGKSEWVCVKEDDFGTILDVIPQ